MNQIVLLTPQELQIIIKDVVSVEVQKLLIPQKLDSVSLPDYLTIKQASVLLNLAVPTIYSMCCKRSIPFNKIDGHKKIYFSKTELNEWLRNGRKLTKSEIVGNLKNSKQSR